MAMTPSLLTLLTLLLIPLKLHSLNQDGLLLLSFKHSILNDPLNILSDWNPNDTIPCSWNGIACMGFPDATIFNWSSNSMKQAQYLTTSRVISLVLPNSHLLGSIPSDLGLVEHLRHLDLSGNELNGTIPSSLFNATELRTLSLANNELSGDLPAFGSKSSALKVINLSENALEGQLHENFTLLPNLTALYLANNYISGEFPGGGFGMVEFLDLSSNLFNGSIPADLVAGQRIRYLNLSNNRLSGEIPAELGLRIESNATVDLSYNNLTGEIPTEGVFGVQRPSAFAGNPELCGVPLKSLCSVPSSPSNVSGSAVPVAAKSPPAFAAIPKDNNGTPAANGGGSGSLRPAAIVAIAVGDMAGVGVLFGLFLYVFQLRRRKEHQQMQQKQKQIAKQQLQDLSGLPGSKRTDVFSCCLKRRDGGGDETELTSETSTSSEAEDEDERNRQIAGNSGMDAKSFSQRKQQQGNAVLVAVDGESELEIETLLKASAYILGATGSSIVYKAVLADGTALAVRRIGESSVIDKLKDFESQIRNIAKFRHPNLLRLRGFYWGPDEKLIIHDYAPNGSLGNISFTKKFGTSPLHLSWETRLRIARGVARGLAYLHDKKSVHGNLKPNNILMDADMEPMIGDFGLDKLITGAGGSCKIGASARQFGSKRSMLSSISLPDLSPVAFGTSPCSSSALIPPNPYQAPESLKNLKPNAKWDVYSFGMILLELLAGRVFSEVELCQWNSGSVAEERSRIVRMSDPVIRGEVEGKEEVMFSCFKLGFLSCAVAPNKRPSMKEALQLLEKVTPSSSSC